MLVTILDPPVFAFSLSSHQYPFDIFPLALVLSVVINNKVQGFSDSTPVLVMKSFHRLLLISGRLTNVVNLSLHIKNRRLISLFNFVLQKNPQFT